MRGNKSLANAMSCACQSAPSSSGSAFSSPTKNASRSSRAAGTCSSSAMPSSSATTPSRAGSLSASPSRCSATSCVSSTAAKRAAVFNGRRSAMASNTTPPSACASRPCWATGRPAFSVAPRSSPPSKAESLIFRGTRRSGVPKGKSFLSNASHSSRAGLAGARNATPPKPHGSTANNAATNPLISKAFADHFVCFAVRGAALDGQRLSSRRGCCGAA